MSRRGRAVGFLLLAIAAAGAAAAIAQGYGSSIARGYGPLRTVVVLGSTLPAGSRIGVKEMGATLAVRRVPERFVPPGALASPAEAIGLLTTATLPAGSYLLAAQLRPPGNGGAARGRLGAGRSPVEVAVSGADALLLGGSKPAGAKVDVIVTTEPAAAGTGRTYVAAREVPLIALRPAVEEPGPGGTAVATLGLTRGQALRLIAAESFARRLTLLRAATG
jgi:Flp pilus assembly protein CpaB